MTEPTDDYSNFYDANGQPIRAGVQLTDEEERDFALFFSDTTDQTIIEEPA